MLKENKFHFIICYNNEQYMQECTKYISFLEVPEGMETEIISVSGAEGMAVGYQAAMEESDAKYKVYLHQDVFILNKHLIRDVLRIFAQHPEYGLLGVAGSSKKIESAVYWGKWNVGGADVCNSMQAVRLRLENPVDLREVAAVDGMLMMTQYDVDWRTDLQTGFDFYDISQSEEFKRAGYLVGVPYQEEAWCFHDCGHRKLEHYEEARKKFCKAYCSAGYTYELDKGLMERRLRGREAEKLIPAAEEILKRGEIAKTEAMLKKMRAFFPYHTDLCMDEIFCEILRREAGRDKRGFWLDDLGDGFREKFAAYKFLLRRLEYGKPTEDLGDVIQWILEFEDGTFEVGNIVAEHAAVHQETVQGKLGELSGKQDPQKDESCEKPLVSVVLASYNHTEYIGEAIESVLNQTYPNFELIIADDASTDGSQEVIRRYQDSRIRYISAGRNTGFGAPEKGFKSVCGKYIVGFTSDDRFLPEWLETSVNFLEKNKTCGACFSRPEIIDSSGKHMDNLQMEAIFETENRTKEEWFYRLYCGGNCFLAPGACVRSDWFWDLGVFRYEYRQLQDYEYWLRLLQKTEVYLHEKKLVQYRIHQDGKNANISSPTREVCQRDYTERLYILLETMEHLAEDFFLKTFYRELIWLPGTEGYCLECEKFCVMSRAAAVPQEAAVFYYYRHYREEKFRHHLETYYGVFRRDIWKLSGGTARIALT